MVAIRPEDFLVGCIEIGSASIFYGFRSSFSDVNEAVGHLSLLLWIHGKFSMSFSTKNIRATHQSFGAGICVSYALIEARIFILQESDSNVDHCSEC
jgi:hypothetical protein